MAVRKLKGSWWVDFQYRGERIRRRSPLNTKGGALEFEIELRHLVLRGGTPARMPDEGSPGREQHPTTFAEFAGRWMRDYVAVNNKPSTRDEKRHALHAHLLGAFGSHALSEITTHEVERYKAEKRLLLCPKSINNQLTILRKCLDTAIEWGALQTLPRIKFLKTEEPTFRYLLPDEAEDLIAASPPGLWRSMIRTALRTGLRFSELVGLQWDDIAWNVGDHGLLTVRRANVNGYIGTPKNHRPRHIPLTSDLAAELRELPRRDLVFMFDGRYVRYDTAWKHLAAICRDAGVPRVSWHDLRHTFASHLISAGAPLKAIQDLLGHSTIEMTMRYAHLAPDARQAAITLLEPRHREPVSAGRQPEPDRALAPRTALAPESLNLLSV